MLRRASDITFIVSMIILVVFTVLTMGHDGYTKGQVREIVEIATDCQAEFFYTHDPQITGVGIPDALKACDPFRAR